MSSKNQSFTQGRSKTLECVCSFIFTTTEEIKKFKQKKKKEKEKSWELIQNWQIADISSMYEESNDST